MWFAIMIIAIWVISAVVTIITKGNLFIFAALVFSVLAGVGYCLLNEK